MDVASFYAALNAQMDTQRKSLIRIRDSKNSAPSPPPSNPQSVCGSESDVLELKDASAMLDVPVKSWAVGALTECVAKLAGPDRSVAVEAASAVLETTGDMSDFVDSVQRITARVVTDAEVKDEEFSKLEAHVELVESLSEYSAAQSERWQAKYNALLDERAGVEEALLEYICGVATTLGLDSDAVHAAVDCLRDTGDVNEFADSVVRISRRLPTREHCIQIAALAGGDTAAFDEAISNYEESQNAEQFVQDIAVAAVNMDREREGNITMANDRLVRVARALGGENPAVLAACDVLDFCGDADDFLDTIERVAAPRRLRRGVM